MAYSVNIRYCPYYVVGMYAYSDTSSHLIYTLTVLGKLLLKVMHYNTAFLPKK